MNRAPGSGSGGEHSAVVDTAQHYPHASFLADREQLIERLLFQQCVPAGEQAQVGIGGFDGGGHQVGLVDTEPDRLDDFLLAQGLQRREGADDGLMEVFGGCWTVGVDVAVVNEQRIETVGEHSLHALLDCAHHTVVGIVVVGHQGWDVTVLTVGGGSVQLRGVSTLPTFVDNTQFRRSR